jgi:hypothetical protein
MREPVNVPVAVENLPRAQLRHLVGLGSTL